MFDGGYGRQMRHTETIVDAGKGRIFHQIDTNEGQSGGPLWLGEGRQADPQVVGIHAYEENHTPADLGVEANSATPMTPEIAGLIKSWNEVG